MSLHQQILDNHTAFLETNKYHSLDKQRKEALAKFSEMGFPKKKNEEYKYINFAEILNKEYNFFPNKENNLTKKKLDDLHLCKENFDYIIFVNGELNKQLSKISIENVKFSSFNEQLKGDYCKETFEEYLNTIEPRENPFSYINLAYCKYGFFLHVPNNTVIEKPIYVFYLSQNQTKNTFYNVRNLLIAESGSAVKVIESHYNLDESFTFTNSVTEIFAYPNANVDWNKLQNDSAMSYLVDNTYIKQEKDSLASVNTFSFGGKVVRNNLDFIHNGENINSFMNGITFINNDQLVDHHTTVYHNFPNCESYQNYKGIFSGKSHGIFNGKVLVDKIAQKTNAYQQNNNILLTEESIIDTKPQLEIFADDVKCSHGCTVGQLDEDALFYMRSRGISKNEAKALLLYAFVHGVIQNINIEPLKLKISKLLADKLGVNIKF